MFTYVYSMGQLVIQKSKYKGVSKVKGLGKYTYWLTQYRTGDHRWQKQCDTERGAALAYDMKMIKIGKEPVNILKRK